MSRHKWRSSEPLLASNPRVSLYHRDHGYIVLAGARLDVHNYRVPRLSALVVRITPWIRLKPNSGFHEDSHRPAAFLPGDRHESQVDTTGQNPWRSCWLKAVRAQVRPRPLEQSGLIARLIVDPMAAWFRLSDGHETVVSVSQSGSVEGGTL